VEVGSGFRRGVEGEIVGAGCVAGVAFCDGGRGC
jgi:hypothetical protein